MVEKKTTGVKSVTLGDVRAVELKTGLKTAPSQTDASKQLDPKMTGDRAPPPGGDLDDDRDLKKLSKKLEKIEKKELKKPSEGVKISL